MGKDILLRIVEAASDYKMGLVNDGFANDNGGISKLRTDLFTLVNCWEYDVEPDDSTP